MMSIPYYHVDAFTTTLFAGSPAGVCLCPVFPPDQVMQQIATENRHSETAFVVPRANGEFALRWFTPKVEDDLCGHATLAAAYVLGLQQHDAWPVRFHTRSGVLTVERHPHGFELDFPSRPPQPCVAPPHLLPALGVQNASVLQSWRDYVVVLDGAESVRRLAPDLKALAALDMGIGGTIVTAPGLGDLDYVCRFFAPSAGIDEDPATGSIQCALAPYWADQLGKQVLNVCQLSPRGGAMRCTVAGDRIRISGEARLYLQGVIHI
jgi:PhzF family phenazine biosynthesis protein